jgi:hypothetical protein
MWHFLNHKIMLVVGGLLLVLIAGFFGRFLFDHSAMTALALQHNNVWFCNLILEPAIDTDPKKNCLHELALANKNLAACEDDALCYSDVAVKYKDLTICDQAHSTATKEFCMQIALPNFKVDKSFNVHCAAMQDPFRQDECYADVAIQTNTPERCYDLRNILSLERCSKFFGDKLALAGKADSICPKQSIMTGGEKMCYLWFAVHTQDPSLCSHLPSYVDPDAGSQEQCLESVKSNQLPF